MTSKTDWRTTDYVYGWRVTAYRTLGQGNEAWQGLFDGEPIPLTFATRGEVFRHVEVCLERNLHPAKIQRKLS